MATPNTLITLGLPAELAKRSGFDIQSKATNGAGQASTGGLIRGPGNKIVQVTMTSASDAATLPADAELGDIIIVYNISAANSGFVFPQVGGFINAGTVNQKATLAAGLSLIFTKATATLWRAALTTAVVLS